MSEYPRWTQQDSNQKGPMPLVASLNGELQLSGAEAEYHRTLMQRGIGGRALLPIILELSVPTLQGSSIPEQFAKAHDAAIGPISDELIDFRIAERSHPQRGVACVLPTPINLGISALVLWEKTAHTWRPDLHWHLDRLTFLADDTSSILGVADEPFKRIPRLGRVVSELPLLSSDDATQRTFEAAAEAQKVNLPDSLDEVESLTRNVMEVHVRDGLTLDSHDYLTCYNFVRAAKQTSPYNPGYAKGVFAALAHHIANNELSELQRRQPEEAKRIIRQIDIIRQSLYWVTATNLSPTNPSRQIGLDYETVRDTAHDIIEGDVKIEGIGAKGIELLTAMFDPRGE